MKKICFILSICLFIQPSSVLAKTFIISDDDKVNETVVIDEFNVDTTGSLFVDMHLLQQMMKNINQQIYKAPIDAKLSTNNEIIPGIPGQMLDKNKFIKQFQAFFYQNKQGKMRIPTKAVHPKVDGELLTEISAKEIGFFPLLIMRQIRNVLIISVWQQKQLIIMYYFLGRLSLLIK